MNVFDKAPSVDKQAFVAPSASLIGNVHVGPASSIWYGCVLRGKLLLPSQSNTLSLITNKRFERLIVQEMLTASVSALVPISKITLLSTLPSPT